MSALDEALRLDDVTVRYRIALDAGLSLKEAVVRWRRRRHVEHQALDALSLSVRRGEVLGVVGRNGAGKTTLLNVMARVVHPTAGRLRIRGSVAALIDLLGGFHPELTGRENVRLRAAFLGLNAAAVRARMDGIVEFAEVGPFLDAPLRTYSTGMVLRLAFAVATSVEAEILLIDEALGVGDAAFQRRCAERIAEFRARGVTFVVVSHDVHGLVELADRVLWLDAGRARALGPAGEVVASYLQSMVPG
jgi:ABC-type polysaccharide/polyol phosphate transport system ATPase subunit